MGDFATRRDVSRRRGESLVPLSARVSGVGGGLTGRTVASPPPPRPFASASPCVRSIARAGRRPRRGPWLPSAQPRARHRTDGRGCAKLTVDFSVPFKTPRDSWWKTLLGTPDGRRRPPQPPSAGSLVVSRGGFLARDALLGICGRRRGSTPPARASTVRRRRPPRRASPRRSRESLGER